MDLTTANGPGYGPMIADHFGLVWNRSATTLAVGEVVMCDFTGGDADSTTGKQDGTAAYNLGNVIVPQVIGIGGLVGVSVHPGYFFGVVVDLGSGAGADNTMVKVQWQGQKVKIKLNNSAILEGSPLVSASVSGTLVKTLKLPASSADEGKKVLGIASEANSSTAGTYECWFDGIHGFGSVPITS